MTKIKKHSTDCKKIGVKRDEEEGNTNGIPDIYLFFFYRIVFLIGQSPKLYLIPSDSWRVLSAHIDSIVGWVDDPTLLKINLFHPFRRF